MLLGSGLNFQSCTSVSFAPVSATESTLEPRRLGYIGQRLKPLLISEERIRGGPGPLGACDRVGPRLAGHMTGTLISRRQPGPPTRPARGSSARVPTNCLDEFC